MSAKKVKANLGKLRGRAMGGAFEFNPYGRMEFFGREEELNPIRKRYETTVAARLMVGLGIKSLDAGMTQDQLQRAYKQRLDGLVDIVKRVRSEQTGSASASFVVQRGLYTHSSGEQIEEQSIQVVIIDFGGDREKFERQMEELADILRVELRQESIIVEIQVNGKSEETWDVMA